MENQISSEEVISDVQDTQLQVQDTNISSSLQGAMWGDAPTNATAEEVAPAVVEEKKPDEEIVDIKDYLKREFEVEDIEVLKAERAEYRKFKEAPPVQEKKFENEQSKKVYDLLLDGKVDEVVEIYTTQKKIDKILSSEVNKDTAGDFIKLNMQLKYKDLTPEEINYKYEKQFGLPKEPTQRADELDEEFADRKSAWVDQVNDIQMNKIIEAKLAKPDLEGSKSKIVFPEIPKTNQEAYQPTQEDLDAFKRQQDLFVQSAEAVVNGFNGFTVQVKDKDVDYSVSYAPSQEEKGLVSSKMKEFSESGFNANAILAERWVKEDGSINVNQMAEDLSRIYMSKNAERKFATDSANKRMELYLKEKKNINLVDTPSGNVPLQGKPESERLQEAFWG